MPKFWLREDYFVKLTSADCFFSKAGNSWLFVWSFWEKSGITRIKKG